MMDFVLSILYLVMLVVTGVLGARWLFDREGTRPAEIWLPLSFALGIAIQGFCYLVSLVVFKHIYLSAFWIPLALLAISNVAFARHAAPWSCFGPFRFAEMLRAGSHRHLYAMGLGLVVIFWGVLYYNAMDYPMASYDGRAIWNYKAKILFHERTVYTEAFQDPLRVHYHREYPLLVPVSAFGFYAFLGHVNEDQVRFFYSTMMVMFTLLIFGLLVERTGHWIALGMALLFCGAPFREYWVIRDAGGINSGEADFPLAIFATLAVTMYYRWWDRRRWPDLVLGAIFAGCTLMIKKEGMIVCTMLLCVNGLFFVLGPLTDRGRAFGQLAASFGLALLVAAPMVILSRDLPNFYDEDYFANFRLSIIGEFPNRLPVIWDVFWNDMTGIDKWNYFWFAYAGFLIARVAFFLRKPSRGKFLATFFFDIAIFTWLTGYLIVYLLSPLNLVFHLNTSLRRLLAHVFPLVVLQVGFSVAAFLRPRRDL